jgi:hypothetical protein
LVMGPAQLPELRANKCLAHVYNLTDSKFVYVTNNTNTTIFV